MSQDESDDPSVPEIHLEPEVIQEMRRMGMDKPAGLPWAKWREPEGLNHRHDEIISLMLQGMPKTQIADMIGMTYQYVITITASPLFKRAYADRRATRDIPVDKKRLTGSFNAAMDVLEAVMMNPDEKGSTRASAAMYVIDQSVGKASGEINVKTSGLIDVIHRLDQMREATSVPVQATDAEALDTPVSAADAVLNELIPTGFVVGKKKDEAETSGEIPEADS